MSNHTETARARQAVRVLRAFHSETLEPYWKDRISRMKDNGAGSVQVAGMLSNRSNEFLNAVNAIEGEIERIKCVESAK